MGSPDVHGTVPATILINRQTRFDAVSGLYVDYLYDTDYADPEELDWPTRNNRLLRYEVRAGGPQGTLLRTVWYT